MHSEIPSDKENAKNRQVAADTSDRAAEDHYDPHMVPAETAARQQREGNTFKQHPSEAVRNNDEIGSDTINTTDGYTVDKEGLLNNYAIEPEMYINEPGDLRKEQEELAAERAEELEEVNEDSAGDLTLEHDNRGRGPGII